MLTKQDLKYLRLAETISTYSDYPRVHIGAVVANRKSLIATGCNKQKSHPEQLKHNRCLPYSISNPRLHAEMDCLVKAAGQTEGSTLYVFRRGRDGEYQNCKPCRACWEKIVECKIRRVVYTIYQGVREIIVSKEVFGESKEVS